ncbi:MAG: type VI secretion system baseplate subunit TssF [Azospirillaceae bacterium]|nr:type VI secretion system baseplate subunit TssF [Azospirillaceae bacterium]
MRREDLLDQYERELLYVRRAGEGFARSYPKIARRLGLGPDEASDPAVERLIESFAFLTARLQLNLEREFPRFTESLLATLYPQWVAPIPSLGIARVEPAVGEGLLTTGYTLPRHTALSALTEEGVRCRYRTCYDVTLWPLVLTDCALEPAERYDFLDGTDAGAVLRLRLETRGTAFETLAIDKIRVFINAEGILTAALHDLLSCSVQATACLMPGQAPVWCRDTAKQAQPLVQAVGFGAEDSVLPYPDHGQPAYRLLQEYFEFPRKFDFYDLALPAGRLQGDRVDVLLVLSRSLPNRLTLRPDTFVLGCTPIVNLFTRTAEPIRLNHRHTAYRVVPDTARERITEVHSILDVTGLRDADSVRHGYVPLFSYQHAQADSEPRGFWTATREITAHDNIPGTDVYLSLHHLDLDIATPSDETLLVHTLCTNRTLPEQVAAGSILMIEAAAPVAAIRCLDKPTAGRPAPIGAMSAWKLISQLSVNHLSLSDQAEGLKALQAMLMVNAPDDSSCHQQIRGLHALSSRPILHRIGEDAWRGFVRGLETTIEIDERSFVGASPLVFAGVLAHFFGLYVNVNSFVQLKLRSVQRQGTWKTWPRFAGRQPVL